MHTWGPRFAPGAQIPGASDTILEPQIHPWGLRSTPGISDPCLVPQMNPWRLRSIPGASGPPWGVGSVEPEITPGASDHPWELQIQPSPLESNP